MLKQLHFKSWLLMLCMLVGVGNVWADEVSVNSFEDISGSLDDYISYEAAKGDASTTPAVYSGVIRVYQNGGLFTVTANNGAKINSIELGSAMATKVTYSIDGGSASSVKSISENGTIVVSELNCSSIVFTCKGTDKNSRLYVNSLSVAYTKPSSSQSSSPTIEGETSFLNSTEVTISSENGATIYYTLDGTDPTNESSVYTSPITLNSTTTVKAIAIENGKTASSVTTKIFTKLDVVENIAGLILSGSPTAVNLSDAIVTFVLGNNAYMEDATAGIYLYGCASGLTAGDKINGVVNVTGYSEYNGLPEITSIDLLNATKTSGNTISPLELTIAELTGDDFNSYISRYVTIKGATVTSAFSNRNATIEQNGSTITLRQQDNNTALTVTEGKVVNVTGHPAIYNTSKQFALWIQDQIEEVETGEPFIDVEENNITLTYDATFGAINYTIDNPVAETALVAESTADWISDIVVDAAAITFTTTANDGTEDRTATITLVYGEVTKDVTVTQGHFVVDYATLPFEYDGNGSSPLPVGLTQNGVGTYGSSPAMKFDGTGDYLVLKFNDQPSTLTFDIKGNPSNGVWEGAFKVQTSEDGVDFTDLVTYSDLTSTVQSEEFDNIGANVRYIKWIYIEKVTGNVALGNIKLAKYSNLSEAGLAYETTAVSVNLGETFTAPTLTNPNNLEVTYSSSNEAVATVDEATGFVTIVGAGTTTISASSEATTIYDAGSASYTLTVVDPNAPGASVSNPYTVAQARAAIDANEGITGVYATGIVSGIVTAFNSQYGNISYNISSDGTTTADQLQAYRGFSYNGENFTSADDIQVGDEVVIYGNLKKHNDTYEFDSGNQLVSLIRKPVIIASSVTLDYDATSGEIAYTIENPVTDTALNVSTDVDWISDIVVDATVITFAATANEGDADRTATITLTYGDVTKDVIVTQGHYVEYVDFAVLPFEWAGGASADLLALNGVSADGLGSDYAAGNAPYLIKLDTTGDYILVKTDSRPGTVTIGVKMLGGANTSTITVQGSADGENFTNVETLNISGAQNAVLTLVTSEDFAENDRYVKLLFTKGSNVGVGPISIAKYSGTVIEKYAVKINESISNGTVAADKEEAAEGATVTLTVEPAEGYVLDVLTVTGVSGEVEVSEDYKFTMPAEAVTVTATFKRATYVTYTLASAITSGKHYIIVGEKDGKYQAMGEQKPNNRGAVEVSVINGTASVVQNSGVYEFIISGNVEDGFTIFDENTQSTGYLYAAGFDKNYLKTQTENDANGIWTITIEENGKASIVAEGSTNRNVMQYNSSNSLFACYASASQSPVYLYEKALKGDVNGDGQVSIADVTALVNIILGKATPETNPEYNFEAANVNEDETISIADVTALVNIILGKE